MNAQTPGAPTEAPTCYRHPGRETYVRCTRCDRYICPECMRDAAVGHQCVECVREGNRSVRQARTVFGGQVAATPVVTYTLITLNVLAYVAEVLSERVVDRFAMLGVWVDQFGMVRPGGVADGEFHRLITAAFLHSPPGSSFSITHILFNMWALWVLGSQLEQVLGRWRFTALYLLSALGGSVLLYLVNPTGAAVGASGAIFGLFGAFFVVAKRMNAPTGGIVTLLVLNLVITFTVSGISWEGHIGGLIVGGLLTAAFAFAPRANRTALHVAAVAGVFLLLMVLVVVQTVRLSDVTML
ncbi:rhomboid family intramembrane serine protease [Thermomonospora cellulosilytica]|uniref:Membrane associated rhomboid family serine protease n=1 Tax=Thermomonospora cellulosilytica TaxID=1411118 RepID=A0A7W3MUQ7_9ACTN|nr:rhomboid family intramembrane serine protease [Thermomonospora cellulosilytica]MBA9002214.1 membrane associated rhomboid family serine protease [Thermomonospora cellulosilytica]